MLLPEGDEHRLQRLELGQFLPAHDLDDRLPLPLAAGKGRRVGRGGDATPGSVFTRRRHAARVPGLACALPSPRPASGSPCSTAARWAHGSGGSRSPMPLATRMTGQFNAWSASDPRMSLRSSSESSDRARPARCPVAYCLPLVLVLVTAPGRCNSLMLQRGTLVGLGCLTEGAQAVGNRRSGGSAGGGHLALRRSEPFADRGQVSIVLPFRLQFLNPRVDSVNPLPDLLSADLPGLRLAAHPSSMPAAGSFATDG